ncbi:MAG: phage tail sheath family protein [Saprospiraceae bacterium]|nr:phage tail sheath family protein [Saprospiraceae bacterium]
MKTPGVYIEETNAFSNSMVGVPTNIPAFVGYTEKAVLNSQDLTHVPTPIGSMQEYQQLFGSGPIPVFQFNGQNAHTAFQWKRNSGLLYDALQLFFMNGGGLCYIVSIGSYDAAPDKSDFFGTDATMRSKQGLKGIDTLTKESTPSLLVVPDAVLLSESDFHAVYNHMLKHCGSMKNRFAILDIWQGYLPRTNQPDTDVIDRFRDGIDQFLQWGAAYYPWIHTKLHQANSVSLANVTIESRSALADALKTEGIIDRIDQIVKTTDATALQTLHQKLTAQSPLYRSVMASLLEQMNLTPPCGAIAGIYVYTDQQSGVQQAPANVGVAGADRVAVIIKDTEQVDLNMPVSGKAVNAIRAFPQGILVWGARTLDGNSQDWRYINVRRTVIYIEQSIQTVSVSYVFEPNIQATWINVRSSIEGFLINLWQSGVFAGSSPSEAFKVQVGLGSTMTQQDILDGLMRVTVLVAIMHPAEFIELTFEIKMQHLNT